MNTQGSFKDVFEAYVARSLYSSGQISRLTGIPLETIKNWRSGKVQRPRSWQDIVKVGKTLHLQKGELDDILAAAGHPTVETLLHGEMTDMEHAILNFWNDNR